MKERKKSIRILAALLCCILFAQLPLQTYAASVQKNYVSELIVSYGEGDGAESAARQWLTDNGYQVVDTNLNEGAESSAILGSPRKARAVYLGYKTTTDADKAITSLKAMNMTGNYSFDEYQKVLDETAAERAVFMESFSVTLNEWRENYNSGKQKGVWAYQLLNLMYDEDKGNTGLGTLLLQPTVEEMGKDAYEALSEEEKMKHADMTTILMQGNTQMVIYIEQIIAFGADTDTATWTDRFEDYGTYSDMMGLLKEEAEEAGVAFLPSEAQEELALAYDDIAGTLALKLADFRETVEAYESSGVTLESSEDAIFKFMEKDLTEAFGWLNAATLTECVKEIGYPSDDDPDRTLYDFIMAGTDAESAECRKEIYPMAAALSEGQKTAIAFVSIPGLLSSSLPTNKDMKKCQEDFERSISALESVSVYAGVDRSIFDPSSTALTDAARKLQTSADRSYAGELFGVDWSASTYVAAGLFLTSLIATTGCAIAAARVNAALAPQRAYDGLVQRVTETFAKNNPTYDPLLYGDAAAKADKIIASFNVGNRTAKVEYYMKGYEAAANYEHYIEPAGYAKLSTALQAATCVLVVVTIATGVWAVISGVQDLEAYYNREYDLYPIPDHMVNQSTDGSGAKVFTVYDAVQCNREELGLTADREVLKDNADLNGDLGKEWLALYATTDKNAGKPITVDEISGFKVTEGGTTEDDMEALTLFGHEDPVNLCDTSWVWNDIHNGLRLYYTVDENAYAASIFDDVNAGVLIGGTAAVSVAVGSLLGYFLGKKRTKKTAVSA